MGKSNDLPSSGRSLIYMAASTKSDIRKVTVMQDLYALAEQNGVIVKRWPLPPPMEGAYIKEAGCPPVIALSDTLVEDSPECRTVLAHELGHHFTTAGEAMSCRLYSYADQLDVGRAEYRADKWAADYLIPWDKLFAAIRGGLEECWQLAEHFCVTEDMVRLKLSVF